MECKDIEMQIKKEEERRRNRYIVECKVLHRCCTGTDRAGRNRYIVECKVDIEPIRILFSLVEIDTLWNVKTEPKEPEGSEDEVEIDTLWNVKYGFAPTLHRYRLSRNRYIVECKAFSRLHR